jgi:hypothetical protein
MFAQTSKSGFLSLIIFKVAYAIAPLSTNK